MVSHYNGVKYIPAFSTPAKTARAAPHFPEPALPPLEFLRARASPPRSPQESPYRAPPPTTAAAPCDPPTSPWPNRLALFCFCRSRRRAALPRPTASGLALFSASRPAAPRAALPACHSPRLLRGR